MKQGIYLIFTLQLVSLFSFSIAGIITPNSSIFFNVGLTLLALSQSVFGAFMMTNKSDSNRKP
jgi:hypothetical protein